MPWSAHQYSRFEDQRTRPARDLVAAIPDMPVHRAVDLGCGPGNATAVLTARYPDAAIVGLDSSDDMIRAARARLPGIAFDVADIADWRAAAPVDVILANAALQWLPDHARLYPQLLAQLAHGGCLAVQTPDNLDTPPHRVARTLAGSARWAPLLGHVAHPPRHPAAWYHTLLSPLCRSVDLWRTTYFHPLPDHAAVVEWFKGAALGPYLVPLDDGMRDEFLDAYRAGIEHVLPAQTDGSVLLPFPRLFLVAQVWRDASGVEAQAACGGHASSEVDGLLRWGSSMSIGCEAFGTSHARRRPTANTRARASTRMPSRRRMPQGDDAGRLGSPQCGHAIARSLSPRPHSVHSIRAIRNASTSIDRVLRDPQVDDSADHQPSPFGHRINSARFFHAPFANAHPHSPLLPPE